MARHGTHPRDIVPFVYGRLASGRFGRLFCKLPAFSSDTLKVRQPPMQVGAAIGGIRFPTHETGTLVKHALPRTRAQDVADAVVRNGRKHYKGRNAPCSVGTRIGTKVCAGLPKENRASFLSQARDREPFLPTSDPSITGEAFGRIDPLHPAGVA